MTRKAITASLLAAGFIAGAATTAYSPISQWTSTAHANTAVNALAARPAVPLPDFTSIVERNGPAVVNISVTRDASDESVAMPQLQPGDPFYEFFRRFGVPAPQEQIPQRGMGSGFIISPTGLILTNAHVVATAKEVTVKLTDKREFRAKVVGVDRPTDVALLKIDADNLPTVRIGSAEGPRACASANG